MAKTKSILYWVSTFLLVLSIASGGFGELILRPEQVQGISHVLGYPIYIMQLLGALKILGSIVIVIPGFPRLKEWMYAGMIFNMAGAFVLNAAVGNLSWHLAVDGSLAILTIVSWALRPPKRMLRTIAKAQTA